MEHLGRSLIHPDFLLIRDFNDRVIIAFAEGQEDITELLRSIVERRRRLFYEGEGDNAQD